MDWQPIETAPRDGTWILVYEGDWIDPRFVGHEVAHWSKSSFGNPAWRDSSDNVFDGATHWMPLPAAPQP
jgi:hypothetical protein